MNDVITKVDGVALAPRVTGSDGRQQAPSVAAASGPQEPAPAERVDAIAKAEKTEIRNAAPGLRLQFGTNQETGEVVIRVLNKDTGELIRQLPAESLQDFLRSRSLDRIVDRFA